MTPATEDSYESGDNSVLISRDGARAAILRAAGDRLAREPFSSVTLDLIAGDARLPSTDVRGMFRDMYEVGSAVLDHERASMHVVQERSSGGTDNPLERLALAFRLVGENLANDIVVRAGVRIAAESRDYFPERRLDPFHTWETFVAAHLTQAYDRGLLRTDLNLSSTTWILVAAGMGTKDLLAFHGAWSDAAERLESTARHILTLISIPAAPAAGTGP
ncbi:hypothetical protein ACI3KS_14080 [Microbacterium sp. ZW T5_45]|uniref:hypothetical protein n=1 Tax=Microbacterium sp. ZW T5_45 TaxID=3378080 RepID=UPI0038519A89